MSESDETPWNPGENVNLPKYLRDKDLRLQVSDLDVGDYTAWTVLDAASDELARLRAENEHLARMHRQAFDLGIHHQSEAERLRAEKARLVEALRAFAEVPPGGGGSAERLLVMPAGDGPFHFLENDLIRAKEVLDAIAAAEGGGDGTV